MEPTAAGFLSSIQVKQVDRDTFRDAPISIAEMTYHYDFTFPFSSYLNITSPDGRNEHIFDTIVERYGRTRNRPTAFVAGFGLTSGALATSTAPDDNNIVCVGTNPEDMAF